MPGLRRQGQELRRRQGHGHAGRQEGRAGRRHRGRGGGRHLVAGQDRARRAADRLGRGRRTPRSRAQRSPTWLKAGLDAPEAFVGNQNGDAKAAIAGAAKKVEAVYAYPYQNHAAMEPMNATALYTADKCEVWVRRRTAKPRSRRRWRRPGCRPTNATCTRSISAAASAGAARSSDYVHQAVRIAKEMPGTPIKLIWSREEDMAHGRYHPVTQCKLIGALRRQQQPDRPAHADFRPVDPRQRAPGRRCRTGAIPLTFQGLNAAAGEHAFGYTIPNLLIDHAMRNPHIPPGFWRGVNINQNAIFSSASWTSWPTRPARTRSSSDAS